TRRYGSPQLRTRTGTTRNMTRLAGMARPPQSRARPEYLAWKRSTSARRSGPSARNSARPWTITPRTSPPPGPDCHGVIVPISARISPGDQPRRPVGDDEQRVGLALDALDAMGRRLRSP